MNNFEKNIISIYGNLGKSWLTNIPAIVQKLANKWQLTDLTYPSPEILSFNFIAFAKLDKQKVVLKISPRTEDLKREALSIQAFAGNGMVQLIAFNDQALLLQRAIAGISLKETYMNDRQAKVKISCEVMRNLLKAEMPSQRSDFMSLNARFAPIFQDFALPQEYLLKAQKFFNQLTVKYQETNLLHGDLHAYNIISNKDGWLAIDPKGLIGHPIIEACCFIEDFEKDTAFIANFFGFELQDLRQIYYSHIILATCWMLEDHLNPEKFLAIAEKINGLV